jgi:hypothetical protein
MKNFSLYILFNVLLLALIIITLKTFDIDFDKYTFALVLYNTIITVIIFYETK